MTRHCPPECRTDREVIRLGAIVRALMVRAGLLRTKESA